MPNSKISVHHWRYEDGWCDVPSYIANSKREFREEIVGWHCWVYGDNSKFEEWMERSMRGKYDCTFRFNSGNPMTTVMIYDDEDATLFKLTWM